MRSSSRVAQVLSACLVLALGMARARTANAGRPAFAYVNANPDHVFNSLSAFRLDASGQATVLPGSPYPTGGIGMAPVPGAEFAHRVEVSRSRNFAFASNDGSGSISVFRIDPLSGALSSVAGSPVLVPNWSAFSGISLAVSNDGRFLYASGTTVVSFFIDDNGALSEVGSEFSFGVRVAGIAVTSDNSRVYLSTTSGVIGLYSGSSGLTDHFPDFLSIGSTPTDLRLDARGTHLWVGTKSSGILAYLLAPNSTAIVPGAPFFLNVSGTSGLSADYYGRFLFALSPTGPRLLGARTGADGSLTLGPNSPLSPALAATSGALTPDGSLLLLSDARGQLDAWSTADDGTLTHAAGYPVATNSAPGFASVATFPDKNPVPAPASSPWLALALAATLTMLGVQRASCRVSN